MTLVTPPPLELVVVRPLPNFAALWCSQKSKNNIYPGKQQKPHHQQQQKRGEGQRRGLLGILDPSVIPNMGFSGPSWLDLLNFHFFKDSGLTDYYF